MHTLTKWPQSITIVRHGESKFNEERELINRGILKEHTMDVRGIRTADTPLSESGKKQADETAEGFMREGKRFDVIYSSPFKRAYQTARIIKKRFRGVKFVTDERLREKEFGIIDGLTLEEISTRYPEEIERLKKQKKYYFRPLGGESYPDVNLRLWSFITSLRRDHLEEDVLVVSHEAVMLSFRKIFEKLSERQILSTDEKDRIKNCACITYQYSEEKRPGMKLTDFNKVYW